MMSKNAPIFQNFHQSTFDTSLPAHISYTFLLFPPPSQCRSLKYRLASFTAFVKAHTTCVERERTMRMLISNVNKMPDQPNHPSLVVSSLFLQTLAFFPFRDSSPSSRFRACHSERKINTFPTRDSWEVPPVRENRT